jgi:hypothetical protein
MLAISFDSADAALTIKGNLGSSFALSNVVWVILYAAIHCRFLLNRI